MIGDCTENESRKYYYKDWKQLVFIPLLSSFICPGGELATSGSWSRVSALHHIDVSCGTILKKSGICSMIWKRCPYYICDTGNMHLHTNICKYDYQILLIDSGMELHCLFWSIKTNLSEPRFACHVYPRCREQQISVRERIVFSSAAEIHLTVLSGWWI